MWLSQNRYMNFNIKWPWPGIIAKICLQKQAETRSRLCNKDYWKQSHSKQVAWWAISISAPRNSMWFIAYFDPNRHIYGFKAELLQLNRTQFSSLGIFISKKVGNRKNYIGYESCILGGLSFFDFQLFYQQKFPGKKIECGLAAVIQLYIVNWKWMVETCVRYL